MEVLSDSGAEPSNPEAVIEVAPKYEVRSLITVPIIGIVMRNAIKSKGRAKNVGTIHFS